MVFFLLTIPPCPVNNISGLSPLSTPPPPAGSGHIPLGGPELEAADLHDGIESERFTEEASLIIFYFYGFLIGRLGAEISATIVR
jgi:hypothetical protein